MLMIVGVGAALAAMLAKVAAKAGAGAGATAAGAGGAAAGLGAAGAGAAGLAGAMGQGAGAGAGAGAAGQGLAAAPGASGLMVDPMIAKGILQVGAQQAPPAAGNAFLGALKNMGKGYIGSGGEGGWADFGKLLGSVQMQGDDWSYAGPQAGGGGMGALMKMLMAPREKKGIMNMGSESAPDSTTIMSPRSARPLLPPLMNY